jgi:hypothetical protein
MGESVRKRCSHGKLKKNCADCNPCPHGKVKYDCADCTRLPAWQAEEALRGLQPAARMAR